MNLKLIVIVFSLLAYQTDAKKIYQWKDADGVMHAVDDPDMVPFQYRSTVKDVDKGGSNLGSAAGVILARAESYKLVLSGLAGIVIFIYLIKRAYRYRRRILREAEKNILKNAYEVSGVDKMSIGEFKLFVTDLLKDMGYSHELPSDSINPVIDFIAEKANIRYAVHVTRPNNPVPRVTVNNTDREKTLFGCTRSMVISDSYFEEEAEELALKLGCELIDRETLSRWIRNYQYNT